MKEIVLKNGLVVKVDDEDFDLVKPFKWNVTGLHRSRYAVASINGKSILMHRLILNVTNRKIQVDHKNHDGLDNQRHNIRLCTVSQNQKNKRPRGTSKFLGVYWDKHRLKWRAQINNGKVTKLGRFLREEDAARAYDEAAKKYHGEYANLNFKHS